MAVSDLAERITAGDKHVAGRIEIDLTDEEMTTVRALARRRNESYRSGQTKNTNFTERRGEKLHIRCLVAETALSICYEEAELDQTISARGDGGIDCTLYVDGELKTADVKSSSYENAWLLVREDGVHGQADVYVSAYVDDNHVEMVGFVEASELVREENLEPSPVQWADHYNYTMREGFKRLPVPNQNHERAELSATATLGKL